MTTSLAAQLQGLQQGRQASAHKKTSDIFPTFLFKASDAKSLSREQIHQLALHGMHHLVTVDNRIDKFLPLLFDQGLVRKQRSMLSNQEAIALGEVLSEFLTFLSPHIFSTSTHQVFEYLLRVFEVHTYNVEDVLRLFLPAHDQGLFVRAISLLDLAGSAFQFLKTNQEEGAPLLRATLVTACAENPRVFAIVRSCATKCHEYNIQNNSAFALWTGVCGDLSRRSDAEGALRAFLPDLLHWLNGPSLQKHSNGEANLGHARERSDPEETQVRLTAFCSSLVVLCMWAASNIFSLRALSAVTTGLLTALSDGDTSMQNRVLQVLAHLLSSQHHLLFHDSTFGVIVEEVRAVKWSQFSDASLIRFAQNCPGFFQHSMTRCAQTIEVPSSQNFLTTWCEHIPQMGRRELEVFIELGATRFHEGSHSVILERCIAKLHDRFEGEFDAAFVSLIERLQLPAHQGSELQQAVFSYISHLFQDDLKYEMLCLPGEVQKLPLVCCLLHPSATIRRIALEHVFGQESKVDAASAGQMILSSLSAECNRAVGLDLLDVVRRHCNIVHLAEAIRSEFVRSVLALIQRLGLDGGEIANWLLKQVRACKDVPKALAAVIAPILRAAIDHVDWVPEKLNGVLQEAGGVAHQDGIFQCILSCDSWRRTNPSLISELVKCVATAPNRESPLTTLIFALATGDSSLPSGPVDAASSLSIFGAQILLGNTIQAKIYLGKWSHTIASGESKTAHQALQKIVESLRSSGKPCLVLFACTLLEDVVAAGDLAPQLRNDVASMATDLLVGALGQAHAAAITNIASTLLAGRAKGPFQNVPACTDKELLELAAKISECMLLVQTATSLIKDPIAAAAAALPFARQISSSHRMIPLASAEQAMLDLFSLRLSAAALVTSSPVQAKTLSEIYAAALLLPAYQVFVEASSQQTETKWIMRSTVSEFQKGASVLDRLLSLNPELTKAFLHANSTVESSIALLTTVSTPFLTNCVHLLQSDPQSQDAFRVMELLESLIRQMPAETSFASAQTKLLDKAFDTLQKLLVKLMDAASKPTAELLDQSLGTLSALAVVCSSAEERHVELLERLAPRIVGSNTNRRHCARCVECCIALVTCMQRCGQHKNLSSYVMALIGTAVASLPQNDSEQDFDPMPFLATLFCGLTSVLTLNVENNVEDDEASDAPTIFVRSTNTSKFSKFLSKPTAAVTRTSVPIHYPILSLLDKVLRRSGDESSSAELKIRPILKLISALPVQQQLRLLDGLIGVYSRHFSSQPADQVPAELFDTAQFEALLSTLARPTLLLARKIIADPLFVEAVIIAHTSSVTLHDTKFVERDDIIVSQTEHCIISTVGVFISALGSDHEAATAELLASTLALCSQTSFIECVTVMSNVSPTAATNEKESEKDPFSKKIQEHLRRQLALGAERSSVQRCRMIRKKSYELLCDRLSWSAAASENALSAQEHRLLQGGAGVFVQRRGSLNTDPQAAGRIFDILQRGAKRLETSAFRGAEQQDQKKKERDYRTVTPDNAVEFQWIVMCTEEAVRAFARSHLGAGSTTAAKGLAGHTLRALTHKYLRIGRDIVGYANLKQLNEEAEQSIVLLPCHAALLSSILVTMGTQSERLGGPFISAFGEEILHLLQETMKYCINRDNVVTSVDLLHSIADSHSQLVVCAVDALQRVLPQLWQLMTSFLPSFFASLASRLIADGDATAGAAKQILSTLEELMDPAHCLTAVSNAISSHLSPKTHNYAVVFTSVHRLLQRMSKKDLADCEFVINGSLFTSAFESFASGATLPSVSTLTTVFTAYGALFLKFREQQCLQLLSRVFVWGFARSPSLGATRRDFHRWTLALGVADFLVRKLNGVSTFLFPMTLNPALEVLNALSDRAVDGEPEEEYSHHKATRQHRTVALEVALRLVTAICTASEDATKADIASGLKNATSYFAQEAIFRGGIFALSKQLGNVEGLSDDRASYSTRVREFVGPAIRAFFDCLRTPLLWSHAQKEILKLLRHAKAEVRQMTLEVFKGVYKDGGDQLASVILAEGLPSFIECTEDQNDAVVEEARLLCNELSRITGQDVLHYMAGA